MNTYKFFEGYLQDQAVVTLAENGNILYEGMAGGAKYYLLKHSKVVSISGLGSNNDIVINIIRDKGWDTDVEDIEF